MTAWRPSLRARRGSRCCAGATRASTSGSSSTWPPMPSRSAATCSRAASWRRWWSPTPCCASCRAPWATRSRRWRSRSRRRSRAGPSIPTTRGRRRTADGRSRRRCSPVTTSGSASGGARRVVPARTATRPLPCFPGMSGVIDSLERSQLRRVPRFAPGDRVRVHFQVIEGTRRRTQVFEGVVLKRQGNGVRETFTVRKQSFGVGVERTFPVHSPKIERIEVAARGDVRRAKLYYLRERVGKRARVRERRYTGPEERVEPGLLNDPVAQLEAEAALSDGAVDDEGVTAEEVVDAGGADDTAADAPVEQADGASEQASGGEAPAS